MIYLAGPYSHPDHHVRCKRYRALTKFAARLMKAGLNVYSPITHSHPMTEFVDLPTDWEFWQRVDREYIEKCDLMLVLCLDGWTESVGVTAECHIAKSLGLPVIHYGEEALVDPLKREIDRMLAKPKATA
jgi:nucleoside 2-deoxyribosyltransferase